MTPRYVIKNAAGEYGAPLAIAGLWVKRHSQATIFTRRVVVRAWARGARTMAAEGFRQPTARAVRLVKRPASPVVNLLVRAHNLLVTKGWTQGCNARTAIGRASLAQSPDAASFCAVGSIAAADWRRGSETFEMAMRLFGVTICGSNSIDTITLWNDAPERTKREVLAAFRAAISAARAAADAAHKSGGV